MLRCMAFVCIEFKFLLRTSILQRYETGEAVSSTIFLPSAATVAANARRQRLAMINMLICIDVDGVNLGINTCAEE